MSWNPKKEGKIFRTAAYTIIDTCIYMTHHLAEKFIDILSLLQPDVNINWS